MRGLPTSSIALGAARKELIRVTTASSIEYGRPAENAKMSGRKSENHRYPKRPSLGENKAATASTATTTISSASRILGAFRRIH